MCIDLKCTFGMHGKCVLLRFGLNSGSRALFTGLTNTFFSTKNFKTRLHDTIHIFKNYFATVFSVFSNKRYLNRLEI